jgi:hypothetical protein
LTPPAGYTYHTRLFADLTAPTWRLWLWANLVALLPLSVAVLLHWLPYQFYLAAGTPLALFPNPAWSSTQTLLLTLLAILTSILLHELLHGLALILLGYRPRFLIESGFPAAGITPGRFITRRHYLFMALLPLVAISSAGGLLLPFLPAALGRPLVYALLLNAAASIGDLLVAQRVRRWPAEALFAEQGGIRVFLPHSP